MNSRRQKIYPRNTRSVTLRNGRGNSLPISVDLVLEILSWLPVKSIAICRCVSKLWAALLGRPDFTDLYLSRSSARPQLLFALEKKWDGFVFFSLNQPQNPAENSSSAVAATRLTHFPCRGEIFGPSNGFVFIRGYLILKNKSVSSSVTFNPSTGQSIILPRRGFLGYDPINKEFKVFSKTLSAGEGDKKKFDEYQILTLGIGKPSRRLIECCIPHVPQTPGGAVRGICINGVFYYIGRINMSPNKSMIVCFDFSSEKFSFIIETLPVYPANAATLINYNGKLGLFVSSERSEYDYVNGRSRSFELWVLEDFEKQEWSKHVYVFPPVWQNLVAETNLYFVGVLGTNEFVFASNIQSDPFYVFYYNTEKNTVVRVGVRGMEAFNGNKVYTFLNHVENVKLIQAF